MAEPSRSSQITGIDQIMERYPDRVYWNGKHSEDLFEELRRIPIRLPAGGTYLFYSKGSTLYLGGVGSGITRFQMGSSWSGEIETEESGVTLKGFGSSKFSTLVVLKSECSLPPGAISIRVMDAPIDLLDQYADLRQATKGRALSESESAEASALVDKLRQQFARSRSRESYPSTRSTPECSGESRGGWSTSRGG